MMTASQKSRQTTTIFKEGIKDLQILENNKMLYDFMQQPKYIYTGRDS